VIQLLRYSQQQGVAYKQCLSSNSVTYIIHFTYNYNEPSSNIFQMTAKEYAYSVNNKYLENVSEYIKMR
jgi:hypothetical protein